MATRELAVSPRLAFLQEELEAGNAAALDAFWQEIAEQGAPIVERIDGDATHVLVTFLWRAKEETDNVRVVGCVFGEQAATGNAMTHMLGADLWYKTYRTQADVRTEYLLSPNDPELLGRQVETWQERTATWQLDTLNPRQRLLPDDGVHPEWEEFFGQMSDTWVRRTTSLVELPAAPPQPWIARRPDVPAGRVEKYRLPSAVLGNSRVTYVYTPPGYATGGDPYGLLILFDGWLYQGIIPTPVILDNLLAEGVIPPLIAVLIDVPDLRERHEVVTFPAYLDFLRQEFVPWVRQDYHVTTDPAKTIVGGMSLTGVTAAVAALRYPEVFGNVLSQSGWFVWKPKDDPEFEWVARQFAQSPKVPLRFYMDVGILKTWSSSEPNQLLSNRHLRTVLQAKDYPVYYREYSGGHQSLCWRGTLADGLVSLVGRKS